MSEQYQMINNVETHPPTKDTQKGEAFCGKNALVREIQNLEFRI
jgi:hypothetical protein